MAGEEIMIPASSGDMPSFSDTVFGFLDENYPSSGNSSDDTFDDREWGDEDDEDGDACDNSEEMKVFWDDQEKLVHGILCRTSSSESRVRNATKEALQQVGDAVNCDCRREVAAEGCRDCLRQGIVDHLCNAGYNCFIQKSKWKSCREIPSGEHTYIEVIEKSSPSKGEVRVIIELNFRAEFEMGRASKEYNQLVRKLPQVYVGKPERLRNIVKILCGAAKKCMKDKKMHLAPWRKHKYMQAKWINSCTEFLYSTTTSKSPVTAKCSGRLAKPSRASLLTQSLIGELSASHRQSIVVI